MKRGSSSRAVGLEAAECLHARVDVVGRVVVDALVSGWPQTMHRPGQSGRSSGAIGSASEIASRTGS